jgi:hypothetical protein
LIRFDFCFYHFLFRFLFCFNQFFLPRFVSHSSCYNTISSLVFLKTSW